jgi:hypothetical protein
MTFSFTFADSNTLPAYAVIFLFHFKIVLVPASALMGSAGIIYGKFLELIFTQ